MFSSSVFKGGKRGGIEGGVFRLVTPVGLQHRQLAVGKNEELPYVYGYMVIPHFSHNVTSRLVDGGGN